MQHIIVIVKTSSGREVAMLVERVATRVLEDDPTGAQTEPPSASRRAVANASTSTGQDQKPAARIKFTIRAWRRSRSGRASFMTRGPKGAAVTSLPACRCWLCRQRPVGHVTRAPVSPHPRPRPPSIRSAAGLPLVRGVDHRRQR